MFSGNNVFANGCQTVRVVTHIFNMGWGGVGMLTFVCSWTRHACYAEHVVGWRCERSVEVEHATHATLSMWWGGDVNVRLKLNTPRMLRWACGGVALTQLGSCVRQQCRPQSVQKRVMVSMPRSINTFDPGNGVGKTLCVLTSWKKPQRSTCTMINESGKAKKGPKFVL